MNLPRTSAPVPRGSSASAEAASYRPLRARIAYALSVLCGLLYFLAFPGMEIWPLAFVALVPLIVAMRGQTPRRAAGLGWLAGFTMTMVGFYWLLGMLQTFSGFPTALCLLIMSALCAYQAGRIALLGWLYARGESRGWPAGVVFAGAFATSELVFPLLFPWYYGATVHQLAPLAQVAELGGPIAVALVLVAVNLAGAELVIAHRERRGVRWKVVAALLVAPILSAGYGWMRISQVEVAVAAAPKGVVGLVQANMSLLGKRRNVDESLNRHLRLARQLQREQRQRGAEIDLVVWSETSVGRAVHEDLARKHYRARFTRHLGVPTLFGSVLLRPVNDQRKYVLFNSALLSDASGDVVGRYDKHFLLAFGEYLPFGDTFPALHELSPNSGRFTPGTTHAPLPLGDHELATCICYEDLSPSFINTMVKAGNPDLLVNMTNDAWFGDTTEPWIHLALAKSRAIEQRRYLIRSTNSGVSAIIDPAGRVVEHTGAFEQAAIAAPIAWLRSSTPFQLWGNGPWWLVAAFSVAAAFSRRRPRS